MHPLNMSHTLRVLQQVDRIYYQLSRSPSFVVSKLSQYDVQGRFRNFERRAEASCGRNKLSLGQQGMGTVYTAPEHAHVNYFENMAVIFLSYLGRSDHRHRSVHECVTLLCSPVLKKLNVCLWCKDSNSCEVI